MPGSRDTVDNDNNDFIKELGVQVVGLDWFLSLDNKNPQIEENTDWIEGKGELKKSESNNSSDSESSIKSHLSKNQSHYPKNASTQRNNADLYS